MQWAGGDTSHPRAIIQKCLLHSRCLQVAKWHPEAWQDTHPTAPKMAQDTSALGNWIQPHTRWLGAELHFSELLCQQCCWDALTHLPVGVPAQSWILPSDDSKRQAKTQKDGLLLVCNTVNLWNPMPQSTGGATSLHRFRNKWIIHKRSARLQITTRRENIWANHHCVCLCVCPIFLLFPWHLLLAIARRDAGLGRPCFCDFAWLLTRSLYFTSQDGKGIVSLHRAQRVLNRGWANQTDLRGGTARNHILQP